MQLFDQGRRGIINSEIINGETILTKTALDDTKKASINKEIIIIQKLNEMNIDFVPQILEFGDGFFSYKYLDGIHFNKFISSTKDKSLLNQAYLNLLNCAYELDKVGVFHGELDRPFSNVLIDENLNVKIIDFDRGKFVENEPKNIKAVAQRFAAINLLKVEDLKQLGSIDDIYKSYIYVYDKIKSKDITYGILGAISSLFLIDQFSKVFIYDKRFLEDFLFFTPVFNKGITRGISINYLFIIVFSIFCIFAFYYLYKKSYLNTILYVLLMGGLLGNFVDRLFLGGVRDFIDFKIWPVFNIADSYLFIAMSLLIFSTIKAEFIKFKNNKG